MEEESPKTNKHERRQQANKKQRGSAGPGHGIKPRHAPYRRQSPNHRQFTDFDDEDSDFDDIE